MKAAFRDKQDLKNMVIVGAASFGRDGDGNLWFFTRNLNQALVHRYDGKTAQVYALDPAFHFAAGKGFSHGTAYVGSSKPEVLALQGGTVRTLAVDLPDGFTAYSIAAVGGDVFCQFIDAYSKPSALHRLDGDAWRALPQKSALEGPLELVAGPGGLMAFGESEACFLKPDGSPKKTFTPCARNVVVGETRFLTHGELDVEVRDATGTVTAKLALFERTKLHLACVCATSLGGDKFLLALEGPPFLYALDGLSADLEPHPHADKIKPDTHIASMELGPDGALWLCIAGARTSYSFMRIDAKGDVKTYKKRK